mgnify:CR=1 FL=1
MKKKLIIFGVSVVVVIFIAAKYLNPAAQETGAELITKAERGEFLVEVTSTGELSAQRSLKIMGPASARDYGIRNITIQRLVEEGTQVKEGEFVAQLDPGELYDKIQQEKEQLDGEYAEYDNARIDTALTLRGERDKLTNLDYQIEEKKLQVEQSVYEPPATITKYKNELRKLRVDKERALENYQLQIRKAEAKMIEQTADLNTRKTRYESMQSLLEDFTIYAPQSGMVIYTKSGMGGERIEEGSQISPWSPEVAELPDLSRMISTTFINEVDIRKIKVGQPVDIGLDAFPEKKLTGNVNRVARVGQQNPNSDAKVFEVVIAVNERDDELRPAMTTSNVIQTQKLEDVVYVPLECLHVFNDSINYVIRKNGSLQEVKLGINNSEAAVIEMGIEEGDELYLSVPEGIEGKSPKLIPELNGTRQQKLQQVDPENPIENAEWLMPNGEPMSPQMIERLKERGITDPSQAQEMMKRFGGGQRQGGATRGGARGGASRSGQPNQ